MRFKNKQKLEEKNGKELNANDYVLISFNLNDLNKIDYFKIKKSALGFQVTIQNRNL
jgi:hypothetical protein